MDNLEEKIRIVIIGIGGVGGYFGGYLAKKYDNSDKVEVIFVARGEHLKKIQEEGLKVIQGAKKFIAKPTLAVENAADIGIADYILIATKTYHLEGALESVRPCVGPETVLLPLLNGVDAAEKISATFPASRVWNGCVYIIARLNEAGVVENSGNIQQLHFGRDNETNPKLLEFDTLLREAEIESHLTQQISKIVWEKYIFISAIATATSYFDESIGMVLSEHEQTFVNLIQEVSLVARARKISVDPEIETIVLNKTRNFPPKATSSMHSDFQNQKSQTELDALTGYVVLEGSRLGLATPTYENCLKRLKESQ